MGSASALKAQKHTGAFFNDVHQILVIHALKLGCQVKSDGIGVINFHSNQKLHGLDLRVLRIEALSVESKLHTLHLAFTNCERRSSSTLMVAFVYNKGVYLGGDLSCLGLRFFGLRNSSCWRSAWPCR